MSLTQLKTVVVFGATGVQGGSVAKALLNDPRTAQQFKVKAITRDPAKPSAQALLEQGADVADLEDKESLRSVLNGAYALFLVTNFWEKMDAALEEQQGKNVADVAKELGIQHFIWSSLSYISKVSGNKYTAAAHFNHKAAVDDYLRSLSLPFTVVRLGIYSSEIISNYVAPMPNDPHSYGIFFPGAASENTQLPILDATADLGKFVNAILLDPEKAIGQSFNVAENLYTFGQITSILQRQGLKVNFYPIDIQTFKAGLAAKGLPESFQTTMQHIVEYILEYGYFHGEGIDDALQLVTDPLTSFENSVQAHPTFKALLKQQQY